MIKPMSAGTTMQRSQTLGPRAYLKSLGFALDKKPNQIDRLLLKALSKDDAELIQRIWTLKNAGLSDGRDMYLLPKSIKEAALLFSYDWPRAAATMQWFDQVISKINPGSVVEMGAGAAFLLSYLHKKYPTVNFQGVEASENLGEVGSKLLGKPIFVGNYIKMPPTGMYNLLICDFGFDNGSFVASTKPHSIETISGVNYCPGCSDDLKLQFDDYLNAWKRWIPSQGHMAVAGRFSNYGMLRAFIMSASDVGLQPDFENSTILKVSLDGNSQRFPALMLKPKETNEAKPELDLLANFFIN